MVVQEVGSQLALAVEAVADGEAGDNPLVPAVVAQVRSHGPRPRLWLGDGAFCDLTLLALLHQGEEHFRVRYNAACQFTADPKQPASTGTDADGRAYTEEWGWLGAATNPQRRRVRRFRLRLDDGRTLCLLTRLLSATDYPAAALLATDRQRWGLETVFQHLVQTFGLRRLIGSTLAATVFQAMLCLVLYNSTQLLRTVVPQPPAPPALSLQVFWQDTVRELTAWFQLLSPATTVALLTERPWCEAASLYRYLEQRLVGGWRPRWQKQPTRRMTSPTPKRAYVCGGHTSIDKVLRGQHHEVTLVTLPNQPPPHETKRPDKDV